MARERDELLTVDQVLAELGGVSRRTFYRWREVGHAPECLRLPNRELRIWRSDLTRWLQARRESVV
jgi:predicted DNA-binding transcriptional regulator AlpA